MSSRRATGTTLAAYGRNTIHAWLPFEIASQRRSGVETSPRVRWDELDFSRNDSPPCLCPNRTMSLLAFVTVLPLSERT